MQRWHLMGAGLGGRVKRWSHRQGAIGRARHGLLANHSLGVAPPLLGVSAGAGEGESSGGVEGGAKRGACGGRRWRSLARSLAGGGSGSWLAGAPAGGSLVCLWAAVVRRPARLLLRWCWCWCWTATAPRSRAPARHSMGGRCCWARAAPATLLRPSHPVRARLFSSPPKTRLAQLKHLSPVRSSLHPHHRRSPATPKPFACADSLELHPRQLGLAPSALQTLRVAGPPPKHSATLLLIYSFTRAPPPYDTTMTTAVAQPPVAAPHAPVLEPGPARVYAPIAPSTNSPHTVTPTSKSSHRVADSNASPTSSSDGSSAAPQRAEGKRSPLSYVL